MYGLGYALAVGRYRRRVKASAPVVYEHRKGRWFDFGINGHDVGPRPFRRIDGRLACRRQQRPRCVVEGCVAHRDELDPHAVVGFDLLLQRERPRLCWPGRGRLVGPVWRRTTTTAAGAPVHARTVGLAGGRQPSAGSTPRSGAPSRGGGRPFRLVPRPGPLAPLAGQVPAEPQPPWGQDESEARHHPESGGRGGKVRLGQALGGKQR